MGGVMRQQGAGHLIILVLIGVALCLYSSGTLHTARAALHPAFSLQHTVLLCVFASLVAGMGLPDRMAQMFARLAGGRRQPPVMHPAEEERLAHALDSLWTMAAGCLVCSGLGMMALHLLATGFGDVFHGMLVAFHWTPLTLTGLEFAVLMVFCLFPAGMIGVALNCTQRAALLRGRSLAMCWAAVLVGVAIGWTILGHITGFPKPWTIALAALVLMLVGLYEGRGLGAATVRSSRPLAPPEIEDRWRGALTVLLGAVSALASCYILVWAELERLAGISVVTITLIIACAAGLVWSHYAGARMRTLERVATMATATAALIAIVVVTVGQSRMLAPEALGWLVVVAWMPIGAAGVCVGALSGALAERGRHSPSGLLAPAMAVALGAAASHALALPELFHRARPYEWFVALSLAWLVCGGLAIVLRPRTRRWPAAAGVGSVLILFAMFLPVQASGWSHLWSGVSARSIGRITPVTSMFEAERMMDYMHTGSTKPGRATSPEDCSVDGMVRRLLIQREHCAVILVTLQADAALLLTSTLKSGLAGQAALKLQPDGVFVVQIEGAADDRMGFEGWPEPVQESFASSMLIPPRRIGHTTMPWTLMGFRDASVAQTQPREP
jgi:hypothetical protein